MDPESLLLQYVRIQPGERGLFLADQTNATDRALIEKLQGALDAIHIPYTVIDVGTLKTREDVRNVLAQCDFVWLSSDMDGAPKDADFYVVADEVMASKKRMVHASGMRASDLEGDGALSVDLEALDTRLHRMEHRLEGTHGLHIRTSYGTDLWMKLLPGQRRWFRETGVVTPGRWGNLPGGELFTTPDEENVDGTIMLPVLHDEITSDQGVDTFVRVTLKQGRIIRVEGGKSADMLREYFNRHAPENKDPRSVLQCSEVAFGANDKARTSVSDESAPYTHPRIPFVEGEKRLGTMHIAFGSSQHGEEGTDGHTHSSTHLDFVIPRAGLTVTAYKDPRDFEFRRGGETLIEDGSWRLV